MGIAFLLQPPGRSMNEAFIVHVVLQACRDLHPQRLSATWGYTPRRRNRSINCLRPVCVQRETGGSVMPMAHSSRFPGSRRYRTRHNPRWFRLRRSLRDPSWRFQRQGPHCLAERRCGQRINTAAMVYY